MHKFKMFLMKFKKQNCHTWGVKRKFKFQLNEWECAFIKFPYLKVHVKVLTIYCSNPNNRKIIENKIIPHTHAIALRCD